MYSNDPLTQLSLKPQDGHFLDNGASQGYQEEETEKVGKEAWCRKEDASNKYKGAIH